MEWIYQCGSAWSTCPDGLCQVYNDHKENHKNPAVEMSKEYRKKTGESMSPRKISTKYDRLISPKEGNKKPKSQPYYWKTVERKLRSISEYMVENCRIDCNISPELSEKVLTHIDFIKTYEDELLKGE